MRQQKKIAILGSTGSIGRQALDIIRDYPQLFVAEVLVANKDIKTLIAQAKEFVPNIIVIADKTKYPQLKKELESLPIKIFAGSESIDQVVGLDCVDLVITAMVGFSGLVPTIRAIEAGKDIALANKETLVVGGNIIKECLKRSKSTIIPVDSEHSAIFQCLQGELNKDINKLILTASGGPFRAREIDSLKNVTPKEALNHPNWKMGNKITIDSATLMNKGLEIIEAHWLFDIPAEKIDLIIHPQSVIHSMVEFVDGSIKAQMGIPSMRIPIQYAIDYPFRTMSKKNQFKFEDYKNLSFEKADLDKYKNLRLAYHCLRKAGNLPCVLNAANEVAVSLFLENKIGFLAMSDLIEDIIAETKFIDNPSLQDYIEIDKSTRIITLEKSKKNYK